MSVVVRNNQIFYWYFFWKSSLQSRPINRYENDDLNKKIINFFL